MGFCGVLSGCWAGHCYGQKKGLAGSTVSASKVIQVRPFFEAHLRWVPLLKLKHLNGIIDWTSRPRHAGHVLFVGLVVV